MNRLTKLLRLALAFGVVATATTAMVATTTNDARACGGFFCSQVPIDQMGEQIIFSIDDGSITATIMIAYTGEAKDFAWILPVASQPELSVGSQAAFSAVNQATRPNYWLDWQYNGSSCGFFYPELAAASDGDDSNATGGGVSVVATEEVGPFDTVVLSSSSTEELINWLEDNGYDQPPEATPLIDHYVKAGMLFVGLKLRQDQGVGDIQPITLKLDEQAPCVPLVLTQVAAVPDMPVRLYLLGEHRVVPTNWMHVVLNEKKIDWINNGSNYDDLVTQAINDAAGRAFVTEYAGSSERMRDRLYRQGQWDLSKIASITDPSDLMDELLRQGFPRDATMQGILRKHLPMPQSLVDEGLDERSFYNNIEAYERDLDGFTLDGAALAADLDQKIVTPLREAQEMFDGHPYLTRLYTTVSPDEMTRDPLFAQNPDLGDVDNNHTAKGETVCNSDQPNEIDQLIITLDDGTVFEIDGPFDPNGWWGQIDIQDPAPDEPAAKRIELIGTSGQPTIVDPSQVTAVDLALNTQDPPEVIDDVHNNIIPVIVRPPTTGNGESSGCQAGGGALALSLSLLVAGLVLVMRRKRLFGLR